MAYAPYFSKVLSKLFHPVRHISFNASFNSSVELIFSFDLLICFSYALANFTKKRSYFALNSAWLGRVTINHLFLAWSRNLLSTANFFLLTEKILRRKLRV